VVVVDVAVSVVSVSVAEVVLLLVVPVVLLLVERVEVPEVVVLVREVDVAVTEVADLEVTEEEVTVPVDTVVAVVRVVVTQEPHKTGHMAWALGPVSGLVQTITAVTVDNSTASVQLGGSGNPLQRAVGAVVGAGEGTAVGPSVTHELQSTGHERRVRFRVTRLVWLQNSTPKSPHGITGSGCPLQRGPVG